MRALALVFATTAALSLIAPRPSQAMPVASFSKGQELAASTRGVEKAQYYYRPYHRPYVYRRYYYRPYYYPYYYRPYGSCMGCGWPYGW
jgi:hypothetical protein